MAFEAFRHAALGKLGSNRQASLLRQAANNVRVVGNNAIHTKVQNGFSYVQVIHLDVKSVTYLRNVPYSGVNYRPRNHLEVQRVRLIHHFFSREQGWKVAS